ncbi:MAG: ATP synthase F1 subunit delta [Candidatus Omnitrophota bacterium]|nr:ATP synthase F1 subunit delta [Candidatus Omnitrophota bacterium]
MDNLEMLHDRYAEALFLLASEHGNLDEVMEELGVLGGQWLENEEFRRFMLHSLITRDDKKRVLETLASEKGFSDTILNFLKLLIDNKRENLIHGVYLRYRDLYEAREHKIRMQVESACPLTKEERFLLMDVLTLKFREEIQLELKENPGLIGGLYLRYRDNIYDNSIRGKLKKLEEILCLY